MRWIAFLLIVVFLSSFSLAQMTELPVESSLKFLEKPAVNKTVTIELEFKALHDLSNVTAEIKLTDPDAPDETVFNNFELVDGSLAWQGNLLQGQTAKVSAKIIARQADYYKVRGTIFADGDYHGKSHVLYPRVLSTKAPIVKGLAENGWRSSCGIDIDEYDKKFSAEMQIEFTRPLEIGKNTGIIASIIPQENLTSATIGLILPSKGFEIIRATASKPQKKGWNDVDINKVVEDCPVWLTWYGDLVKDERINIDIEATVLSPGWGTPRFRVSKTVREGDNVFTIGQRKKVDVIVDKEFYRISEPLCEKEECKEFDSTIGKKRNWWWKFKRFLKDYFGLR